jgi:glycosyltransferase involved in cell wall biosynthesis
MRIAVNAWFWNRPDTGSGQYTHQLVTHLATLDPAMEILLIYPRGRGMRVETFDLKPATRNPQPPTSSLTKLYFEQITFPRACRDLGVHLAHVPYWAPPASPGVPTIVTIHDLIPLVLRAYRGGPLVRLYTSLVSATAANAALILTDSEASREDILARLDLSPDRVRAIPLAADARFCPGAADDDAAVRAQYNLPGRYTLYLGGFDVRKNVATALKTTAWVGPAIGDDCPLVVAGRLPERDTGFAPDPCRQAREMGLEAEWVHFIGWVAEEDKPAIYRGAAAFVFPSFYEGFGLPPLEAMACGVPVVGSDAASLPEVVGEGGVLLDPMDAEGMAGALIQLATDEAFHTDIRRRALDQAATFSWERTAQETLAAYREVLASA